MNNTRKNPNTILNKYPFDILFRVIVTFVIITLSRRSRNFPNKIKLNQLIYLEGYKFVCAFKEKVE